MNMPRLVAGSANPVGTANGLRTKLTLPLAGRGVVTMPSAFSSQDSAISFGLTGEFKEFRELTDAKWRTRLRP